MSTKIGIVGVGAIGSAVARALTHSSDYGDSANLDGNTGFDDLELDCISDPACTTDFGVINTDIDTLVDRCDIILECLPAHLVPDLADKVFDADKDILFISSAALLLYPTIVDNLKESNSCAYLPSGALCGLDGVRAMREMGITSSKIASTKPPMGFSGAPYVIENNISLENITEKTLIFEGNALDASRGFPANINVAATLSLAGIGAKETRVEIWADPAAKGNAHEITVTSKYSTLVAKVENMPDPANPKSSVLAAQSIVATLRNMSSALMIT